MSIRVSQNKIKSLGLFSPATAKKKLNISQPTLSRWLLEQRIVRVERGVYLHPQHRIPADQMDFAVACFRFGRKAVIGGPSALFHYNLIDTPPRQIWVLMPPHCQHSVITSKYRFIRTNQPLRLGVNKTKHFKITNVERTVVEAAKFSSRLGRNAVLLVFQRALQYRLTTENKIGGMASKMNLKQAVRSYMELI